jgi:hypothetical protein
VMNNKCWNKWNLKRSSHGLTQVLPMHLPGWNELRHSKAKLGYSVSCPGFEPITSLAVSLGQPNRSELCSNELTKNVVLWDMTPRGL